MLRVSKNANQLKIYLIIIIFSILGSSSSLANSQSSKYNGLNITAWRGVLALGLGAAFSSHVGGSSVFPIRAPVTSQFYVYNPNRANQASSLFDAFIGMEWPLYPFDWCAFDWQIGLGFKQAWDWNSHGSLLQGASVTLANSFPYHFDILTRQALIETKLHYELLKCYRPYIMFGIGLSFNEAEGFATIVPSPLTTLYFKDNTERSYTYIVGAGIDVNVLDYLRFGIGYRFGDLGQVQLGHARINGVLVTGTLNQNHLYASEVLGQVTILL